MNQTRRNIALRQFSLYAICLLVSLGGTVSAQADLIEHNEKDDPCAHFKMRILVPGNHGDFKQAEKLKDGTDYKMVWNPCPQADPQFAFAPAAPAPNRRGNFLIQRSFGFQFSTVEQFHFHIGARRQRDPLTITGSSPPHDPPMMFSIAMLRSWAAIRPRVQTRSCHRPPSVTETSVHP